MYRPEGWKEIKDRLIVNRVNPSVDDALIEAGADAMLEGLLKSGVLIRDLRDADIRYGGKLVPSLNGYLVFIPEEE